MVVYYLSNFGSIQLGREVRCEFCSVYMQSKVALDHASTQLLMLTSEQPQYPLSSVENRIFVGHHHSIDNYFPSLCTYCCYF